MWEVTFSAAAGMALGNAEGEGHCAAANPPGRHRRPKPVLSGAWGDGV